MQYTENYQFRKPIRGVDEAKIDDLNFNADRYDALIHASQVSLADAYDSTETYNTDDIVMYEFLMYKCLEDNVTGSWDATKWERTTAGENGGGGTEVEANPSGTATAGDLTKLRVGQDIYSIPSGGGGGTTVVPNPVGEPTDTLNTIGIAGTIYDISGSGGGSGSGFEQTLLYDSGSTTSGAPFNQNVNLLDSLSNYDFIMVEWNTTEDRTRESPLETSDIVICSVQELMSNNFCLHFSGYDTRWGEIVFTDTTFNFFARGGDLTPQLYKIWGIKFGGAGTNAEIIPITGGDGTTSRTFTFPKTPKFIKLYFQDLTLDNGWLVDSSIVWGQAYATTLGHRVFVEAANANGGCIALTYPTGDKSVTITAGNAFQACNTVNGTGFMYVDYGESSSGSGVARKDVLYNDANGAAHLTWIALTHNINDYDVIYMKISNPTDINSFNLYTHHSFMPMMYGGSSERVSVQGLYGQRVVDVVFDGASFEIIRTDGDFRDNTIYEIVGIKY